MNPRIAFSVDSDRWMHELGRAPVTTFSMCIQVWVDGKEPICKIYSLNSAQFIKARDLQNRLVGCHNRSADKEVWESYASGPDEIKNGTAVWH